MVPTARTPTRHHLCHGEHYSALVAKILHHIARCDRVKMGYQNRLLVSRDVPPDRPEKNINFATSTDHGQVTVKPFSDEERDTTDQRIKRRTHT